MTSAPDPTTPWRPSFYEEGPWFGPIARAAARFRTFDTWPAVSDYGASLEPAWLPSAAPGVPLRFVEQGGGRRRRGQRVPRDVTTLYDGRIALEGCVPTRPRNWHDFFNMLVWASFPRAKLALHRRQLDAHRARLPGPFVRQPGARTREQDALAMVDEGGLLLLSSPRSRADVEGAVARGDIAALAGHAARGAVKALLFGHALYEHLVCATTVVRAFPVVAVAPRESSLTVEGARDQADGALARLLAEPGSFAAPSAVAAVPLTAALFVTA